MAGPPLVSVVFDAGYDEALAAASLASLEAQTLPDWERVGSLSEATGEYVAFLDAGDLWVPERLERLVAAIRARRGDGPVADAMVGTRGNGDTVRFDGLGESGWDVEPARVLFERAVLENGGGIDPEAGPAWPLAFLLRSESLLVTAVPSVGVHRRFPDRRRAMRPAPGNFRNRVLGWDGVVNAGVGWSVLEWTSGAPGRTSVIVPTYEDAELTTACVESVVAAGDPGVQIIVFDNGSAPEIGTQLDTLRRHEAVRVEHARENHGFALGNDLALDRGASGDVVVFLNNDTTVSPGWLAPLRAALDEPDVLGVQPLLLYPTGSIQSAGIAFPTAGGLPHNFLQGFPVEDAAGVDDLRFHAITGAAMALRTSDVVELRGFDAIYTNGLEDVDLCHRLAQLRPGGHFRVVTDVPVVHHESRTPGRFDKHLANREVYLRRWRGVLEPRDDAALWATRGLDVLGHEIAPRQGEPHRLSIPRPLLVRDRLRPLRWAIKNPAPAGEGGDRWGDTPFAAALARALRDLGQEVVVDRRPEWGRATGRHDDVALVLRGLVAPDPSPVQVTLGWVISHPEDVTPEEARGYDRLLAAGPAWAARRSTEWGLSIEALLQATDPGLFRPRDVDAGSGPAVLFVGNSRRVLRPVVADALAAGLPLTVFGDLWSGLVPDHVVAGRTLPNAEVSSAYAAAGVVLNDHHETMRTEGFVSNRLFDAVASGARVVSDDVAGLPGGLHGLFGESVQVYRTPDDLARLADPAGYDATFGDAEARRSVAERVRTEHSFAARARRLVEVALEARAARGLSGTP